MWSLHSPFRDASCVDTYMERAHALKNEHQIFFREVKFLIGKLDGSLKHAQGAGVRGRIPGSAYSLAEVRNRTNALRSVLLAAEVIRRSQEDPAAPAALRSRARTQLLRAVSAL